MVPFICEKNILKCIKFFNSIPIKFLFTGRIQGSYTSSEMSPRKAERREKHCHIANWIEAKI